MNRAGAAIARKLRGKTGAPPRAPKRLDRMTDADLAAAIAERREYVRQAKTRTAREIPVSEREGTLKVLGETVDDLKRLEAESARRPEPPRVTSSGADARTDAPVDAVLPGLRGSPSERLAAQRAWAAEQKHREEAAWQRREREKRERAELVRRANEERAERKRAHLAAQGLGPESPDDWARWHADGRDLLAAVFSAETLLRELVGKRCDGGHDRNPPLHADDLACLYGVLAAMAARGTREVVISPTGGADLWRPMGTMRQSSGSSEEVLRHLEANDLLAIRKGEGLLFVGPGPLALRLADEYRKQRAKS